MEEIIKNLARNFYSSLGSFSFGASLSKEVKFNGGSVWIESYDEDDNTFTVCVGHNNMNESPNVEDYLSKELAARIDIADAILQVRDIEEKALLEEEETRRSVCWASGWNY